MILDRLSPMTVLRMIIYKSIRKAGIPYYNIVGSIEQQPMMITFTLINKVTSLDEHILQFIIT